VGACSKVGKDLYLTFDMFEGLTLSTLNEAKSAYLRFDFHPSFFTQCTAPTLDILDKSRKRSRSSQRMSASLQTPNDDPSNTEDDNGNETYLTCCLSIRALTAAVRQRKNVESLRIYMEENNSTLQLCFEYFLANGSSTRQAIDCMRVIHRVPVSDFPVAVVSADATLDDASEVVVQPRVLLRLLEPLARRSETVLTVPNPSTDSNIIATCFQPTTSNSETLLTASQLQTEMRLPLEDLNEMEFVDNRQQDENVNEIDALPDGVNESVTLVFSHRECKAFLQWAVEHIPLHLFFHWGGKPLVLQQKVDQWKAKLVLATLDHKILGSAGATDDSTKGN
jgi:hypothetical protein